MADDFDAEEFYAKLAEGAFDGELYERLAKLSADRLAAVARLMRERGPSGKDADLKP